MGYRPTDKWRNGEITTGTVSSADSPEKFVFPQERFRAMVEKVYGVTSPGIESKKGVKRS